MLLRKLLWSALYAAFGAGAAIGARRTATSIWRMATGEDPPTTR